MSSAQLKIWFRLSFLLIGSLAKLILASFICNSTVYINPQPNTDKTWTEAQEICKNHNATLPIVSNPERQRCFASALSNFGIDANEAYVWLGAKSFVETTRMWRWVDASSFSGEVKSLDGSSYLQSYATIGADLKFNASKPTDRSPYICRYKASDATNCNNRSGPMAYVRDNICFVKYNEALTWFGARNNCLWNNGDLAFSSDISIFRQMLLSNNNYWWIGLRSIWWNWTDTESNEKEVTFTQWSDGQPNGQEFPECISIDAPESNSIDVRWRDFECSKPSPFICQLSLLSSSSSSSSSPRTTSSQTTSSPINSTLSVLQRVTPKENEVNKNATIDNIALGVGLGVGLGVPLVVAIIVVVLLLIRKQRKSSFGRKHETKGTRNSSNSPSPAGGTLVQPQNPIYAEVGRQHNASGSTSEHSTEIPQHQIEYASLDIVTDA